MKIKLVAAGVLAVGAAVTGLTGSAYAADGAPATRTTAPARTPDVRLTGTAAGVAKDLRGIGIVCTGRTVRIKGNSARVSLSVKASRKAPALSMLKLLAVKGKSGVVRFGPAGKGLRCVRVKPGTPGAPPLVPAR